MKTYTGDIGAIMANLKENQKVIFGTNNPIFIQLLIKLAETNPSKQYYIPYTKRNGTLAEMYSKFTFPDNILFEEGFAAMIQEFKQDVSN